MNTGAAFAPVSESTEKPKRKKASKSPSQLSMERFRSMGCTVQKVERWQASFSGQGGGVRIDLFGCIDLIAMADFRIVGVQCGAYSGHSTHRKKCLAEPRVLEWLQCGARMLIQSWHQPKGKGTSWVMREEELRVEDFATTAELDLL